MSVTLDQAVQMARAQKKSGKILTIGFQPRYDANRQMVKEIVRSGELGDIYYIQTGGGRRRGIPGGTFIDKELAGVGCLADIGCYGLDMALNSAGYRKPVSVSAFASDLFGKNPKYCKEHKSFSVDDFTAALIRFEDGLVMDFRMSWAMHMDTMGDTLFLGTKAGLKVKSWNPKANWGGAWDGTIGDVFLYTDLCGNQVETQIPTKGWTQSDNFAAKVRDFLDAVKCGGPSPIPWQEIIYNQAIIDGIIRSSEKKREVEVAVPEI
jgi:predicted dehydrogenase